VYGPNQLIVFLAELELLIQDETNFETSIGRFIIMLRA